MTRASAARTTTSVACATASASHSDTVPASVNYHTDDHQVIPRHGPTPTPTPRKHQLQRQPQQQHLDQMERSTSVTCSASDWDCARTDAPRGDSRPSRRKRRGCNGRHEQGKPSTVMSGESISVASRSGSVSSLSTAADDDIDEFDAFDDEDDDDSWMVGRRGCRRMDRVAEALRSGVRVKDRTWHFITYKKCFVGSEAVDLLVRGGYASTRAEAVRLGRDVAAEYDLFEHVCRDHEFKDDFLFYRFKETSVPITVKLGGCDAAGDRDGHDGKPALCLSDKELATAVAALDRVEVRDRRHHLAIHSACFVGSEAVDALVFSGVAKSRSNAVLIGREVAARRRLFHHVVDPSHPLEDGYHFYRFRERRAAPEENDNDNDDSDCDTAVSSISSTSARLRAEAARRRRRAMVWPGRNQPLHQQQQQHPQQQPPPTSLLSFTWQSLRSTSIGSGSGTAGGDSSATAAAKTVVADLGGYVRALRRVEVKDRIVTGDDGRGTVHRRCFRGSDAVNAMIHAGYAGSRSEGAAICQRLMAECNLFEDVVVALHGTAGGDGIFRDGAEQLYRFTKSMPGRGGRSKSKSRRRAAREKKVLDFLATVLRKVEVKDRKWRLLKTYPRVFVGREAVDLLVEGKYAKSRSDAVRIGRRLVTECNLFERVVGDPSGGAVFDDDCCFYRFKEIK